METTERKVARLTKHCEEVLSEFDAELREKTKQAWAVYVDKQAPVPAAIAAGLKLVELLYI